MPLLKSTVLGEDAEIQTLLFWPFFLSLHKLDRVGNYVLSLVVWKLQKWKLPICLHTIVRTIIILSSLWWFDSKWARCGFRMNIFFDTFLDQMKFSVVGKSIYFYVVFCSPFDTMDTFVVFSQEFGAHRADDFSGQEQ